MATRTLFLLPLLVLAVATSAAGEQQHRGPREVGALEGIWKMCYEPGLEHVVEVDSGYLVLLPGGRYYEVSASCCAMEEDPQPPYWELGDYEREADGTVVLHSRRSDGTPMTIRLRHHPAVRAVFFDDVRAEPVETEALAAGESIDYGFCRVYPGPEGFGRSPSAASGDGVDSAPPRSPTARLTLDAESSTRGRGRASTGWRARGGGALRAAHRSPRGRGRRRCR